jgi:ribosomal protein S4
VYKKVYSLRKKFYYNKNNFIILYKKYIKNGRKILNYIFEVYQNNFRYKKLLRFHKNKFFLLRRKPRFLYKIVTKEKEFIRQKRTFKIKFYLNMLKLRRFYGNVTKKKFKQLFNQCALNSNFLGRSFIFLLETRLDVILYRANFFKSIFSAKQYILHQGVYVNGLLLRKPNFKIKLFDLIFVKNVNIFYKDIYQKLKNKKLFVNFPSYLEVNYRLGLITLFKIPNYKEVPFPFFFKYYKHVGFNFLK